MKDYTSNDPIFSSSIRLVETTDPAHADNINAAPIQLLQNILLIAAVLDTALVDKAFSDEFSDIRDTEDDTETTGTQALTADMIRQAISTQWNGETSADPNALSADEITESINTEWNGEASSDSGALSPEQIMEAIS